MRRMTGRDEGAVAVLTALLALVLFGMAALVVDAGAFYLEKRELQNGADAAAYAVAADCAADLPACLAYASTSASFADSNAFDEESGVDEVCGTTPLPACPPPATPEEEAEAEAIAGRDFVRVRTVTDDGEGGDEVPWIFGRLLADGEGTTIKASATVVFGAPGTLESAIPVTMSACEWEDFTADGGALAPAPDYRAYPGKGYSSTWLTTAGLAYERTFFTHNTSTETSGTESECPATPPGGDAAGSFGWLSDTDEDCSVTTSVNEEGDIGYENQPGNTVPSVCKNGSFPQPGTVVHVPVYDHYTVGGTVGGPGGGQRVWYHLAGYAAFYITGYNLQLPAGEDRRSIVTNRFPCSGSDRCFSGFFTSGLVPSIGAVGSGPSYGTSTTQLVD